ncbi:MAG TPA: RHS repeat-associated core domain-containing protein, partial [Flavisolibacter sp.]|nr:RHS repeat-associated core domain-containing protein [Flavisolibacter sp.]
SEMDDPADGGVGWNDFALRNYDAQIGRWVQQDPFDEFASPYLGMGNDPVNSIDPSGGNVFTGLTPLAKTAVLTLSGAIVGGAVDAISGGDGWTGVGIGAGVGLGAGTIGFVGTILRSLNTATTAINTSILSSQVGTNSLASFAQYQNPVTYEALIKKYGAGMTFALSGAYSTALSLYTGRYNTYGSVSFETMNNLSEDQKQKDFSSSSAKATAILMFEFLTGTGKAHRSFSEGHPITQEIKWSESSRLAIWAMVSDFQKGRYKDGQTRGYYAALAPDKGISGIESLRRHLNARLYSPATFYRGGMYYYMTKFGNNIQVKAVDGYTVASMITRNTADNIKRIPGKRTPLGTTTVEFNFTWGNVNFSKTKQ